MPFITHHVPFSLIVPYPTWQLPPPIPTCRGRFGMRQVTPKATSRRFVKAKARMALVTFWICRSRFFFFSPLWKYEIYPGAGSSLEEDGVSQEFRPEES